MTTSYGKYGKRANCEGFINEMLDDGVSYRGIYSGLTDQGVDSMTANSMIFELNDLKRKALPEGYFQAGLRNLTELKCEVPSCSCRGKDDLIPGSTAFLWIPKDVVELRAEHLTRVDIDLYLEKATSDLQRAFRSRFSFPYFLCEVQVRRLGLDTYMALDDAKKFAKTGLAPLRATIMTGRRRSVMDVIGPPVPI